MVVITPIELQEPEGLTTDHVRKDRRATRPSAVACAAALAVADALALVTSLGVAVWAVSLQADEARELDGAAQMLTGIAALVMLGFTALRHYGRRRSGLREVRDVVAASAAGLLCSGFLAYMLRLDAGREPLLVMWLMAGPAVLLARGAARAALHGSEAWQSQAIVVGQGEMADHAMRLLDGAGRDHSIVGVLHPSRIGTMRHGRWSVLLRRHQADLVVLAMDDPPRELTRSLLRDRVPFAIVRRPDDLPVHGGTPLRLLSHDAMLWSYRDNLQQPVARAAKLAIDLGGALAMLVVLAPVLLLIAAAVKIDGGTVLYAHRRIGASGRSFPCLKFRSMVPDSEAVLAHLLNTDPGAAAEWAATRKLRDDPRVTWIGRMLRQTSLDELPQLFNVLRLEMSLVGPRPIVQAEVPRYGDDIHHYYAARPGLTGLWQVSGRSDTGYNQRVQLDTWYVKNWSLWHDIAILARTVPAVLKRKGAV